MIPWKPTPLRNRIRWWWIDHRPMLAKTHRRKLSEKLRLARAQENELLQERLKSLDALCKRLSRIDFRKRDGEYCVRISFNHLMMWKMDERQQGMLADWAGAQVRRQFSMSKFVEPPPKEARNCYP